MPRRWMPPSPSPPFAFLILGGTLGIALLAASPPFRWGDENTHFLQAFRLAEGNLRPACSSAGANASAPRGIVQLVYFVSLLHKKNRTISRQELGRFGAFVVRRDKRVATRLERAPYSPIPYVPQAAAITAASLGTRSAMMLYVAARIGNFVNWLGLIWLAIRIAPSFGWSFAVVALCPMGMFLATVCSVDASANALSLLWTAYVLRSAGRAEDRIDGSELLTLTALALALTLTKFVYAALIPLTLVIPARRAGGRLRLLALVGFLLALACGAVAGWMALAGPGCLAGTASTSPESVAVQWRSLSENPSYFLRLLGGVATRVRTNLTFDLIDTKWAIRLPTITASRLFLGAILLALVCDDRGPGSLSLARRAVAFGVAVSGFLAVVLIAFVYWTPARASAVHGFQMRYMLPLLPPLLIALKPPRLPIPEPARRLGGFAAVLIMAGLLIRTIRHGLALYVA